MMTELQGAVKTSTFIKSSDFQTTITKQDLQKSIKRIKSQIFGDSTSNQNSNLKRDDDNNVNNVNNVENDNNLNNNNDNNINNNDDNVNSNTNEVDDSDGVILNNEIISTND